MPLSRRRFLQAGSLAALAAGLDACVPAVLPPASGATAPGTIGSAAPTGIASPPSSAGALPSPSPTSDPAELRRKVGGLLVVGFRGLTVTASDPVARAIAEDGLGGVILFDRDQLTGQVRNISSPGQLADLTGALRAFAGGRPLSVAVDQEGGRVARLTPSNGFPATVSEAVVGRGDVAAAAQIGGETARTLRAAGIDWNFAPVVDLDVNPANPSIGALGRSFSADPDVVVAMATAIIGAHRAAHVLTTLKHYPGLGSATGNTDAGFVDISDTWGPAELEPFRRLISSGIADAVMVANALNRRIDPALPASLSLATVRGGLRADPAGAAGAAGAGLGWNGLVVTDDLQAGAIRDRYPDAEAVELALAAGNDVLLFANQQVYVPDVARRTIDLIVGLVTAGRIAEQAIDASLARIAAARSGAIR